MDLNEYEQNLDKFYRLKNKYYEKINREKQKLIANPDLSKKEKRIKFSETAVKCINCKNRGGTVFETNKDFFRVTCGNTEKPCSLNLYFERQKRDLVDEKLVKYIKILSDLKEGIIRLKLDYLLGFISEEESIVQFTTVKKELNDNYEIYRELLERYHNIVGNLQNQEEINTSLKEKQDIIVELKKHVEKYKFTNNISEITELVELYIGDLDKLLNRLRTLQYRNIYVHSENDEHRLKKEYYSLKDLEIQK